MKSEKHNLKDRITELAGSQFIDELRFIDAGELTEAYLGDPRKFAGRQPADIMPAAKTVIIAGIYIGRFVTKPSGAYGRMSRLVLSGYYANIVRPLRPIREYLSLKGYEAFVIDGESDEKSIPLKGAAVKAGLGWIGKNSLLISSRYGSFLALGAILTDADLSERYPAMKNLCGSCSKCMDHCPVKAIEIPRQLDRSKCISNLLDHSDLTIEPGADTHGYFFECDICQNICPWNQKHIQAPLDTPYGRRFHAEELNDLLRLEHLRDMDEETYEKELAPLMAGHKLPYRTFRRNMEVLIQTGNR